MQPIHKVLVVGTGTMGKQISILLASKGLEVILKSRNEDALQYSFKEINEQLQQELQKQRLTTIQKRDIQSKITGITLFSEIDTADLVIEAIVEDIDQKKLLFQKMDSVIPINTIFASDTSSLSVTELSKVTNRQDKIIGLHFFNPASKMKLVEVVRGESTSQNTINVILNFLLYLEKIPIIVKDSPGFVVNRILFPMINESIYTLMEGVADKEAIDLGMKLGLNHPMGPLELSDLIGLDICLDVLNTLFNRTKDSKYKPCPLLIQMVENNHLGRKSKKGFYTYH